MRADFRALISVSSAQSAAEFAEKTCVYTYVDRFSNRTLKPNSGKPASLPGRAQVIAPGSSACPLPGQRAP